MDVYLRSTSGFTPLTLGIVLVLRQPHKGPSLPGISTSKNKTEASCDHQPSPHPNPDDRVRLFLVVWIALITILILIVFALTRDASVLATNTLLGAAITLVFNSYFRKKP